MAPSDRQIINPIGYKTVLGYVTIRAVVRIGIKWVVPDSSQAGIRSVQSTAFLIKIGVGHIQHEAAPVTPREFGLEGVGISMPEVSVGEQKLSDQRERQSIQVLSRVGAASLRRIANRWRRRGSDRWRRRGSDSLGCAKRFIVRGEFIQI